MLTEDERHALSKAAFLLYRAGQSEGDALVNTIGGLELEESEADAVADGLRTLVVAGQVDRVLAAFGGKAGR